MLNVSRNQIGLYPIFNDLVPPEGSKGIFLQLDFNISSHYDLSAGFLVSREFFQICQTIWIDTTSATANVTVTVERTNQRITVKPDTQGYYPIFCANQFGLSFDSASLSVVKVILLNMPIKSAQISVSAGDAMVFLQSKTAANSATIDFTSQITASYRVYLLLLTDLVFDTNAIDFLMQVSTDNGGTYDAGANYDSSVLAWDFTGSGSNGAAGRTSMLIASRCANTANWRLNGSIYIYGPGSSGFTFVDSDVNNFDSTNAKIDGWKGKSTYKITTAVNAFRVLPSAGLIVSGSLDLYGMQIA